MLRFKKFVEDSNYDKDEQQAEMDFRSGLKNMHSDGVHIYHETPGHVADSIRKTGLGGGDEGYGMFGTVGQNSNFVTSKKKTITHFVVPHSHAHLIHHDMRYDDFQHLMREHPNVKGADVSIAVDKVPSNWIKNIKEVG